MANFLAWKRKKALNENKFGKHKQKQQLQLEK